MSERSPNDGLVMFALLMAALGFVMGITFCKFVLPKVVCASEEAR